MFKRLNCLFLALLILISTFSPVLAVDGSNNEIPTVSLEALQKILASEGEAAYAEKEIKDYVKEIIPLIEKFTGKKIYQGTSS